LQQSKIKRLDKTKKPEINSGSFKTKKTNEKQTIGVATPQR
jgi:hypothetical protein